MRRVGLVVNPVAGKDIRRLVAWGSVFGNREKITALIRFLQGFLGVTRESFCFVYMPDPYELVEVARREVTFPSRIRFEKAPTPTFGDATDTLRFTEWAVQEGRVEALVVFGGDGTNRVVAKKSGSTPLFSLSCGTNNVFADTLEPTLGGMALGFFLEGAVPKTEVLSRSKVLRCFSGTREDIALVDVVFVEKDVLGTRAVWEPETVRFVAVTQSSPANIGLSAVIGRMVSISPKERRGAFAWVGQGGQRIPVPLAPGLVREVGVEEFGFLLPGEPLKLPQGKGALALDGEREILVHPHEAWWICLEDQGPVKADLRRILELTQGRSGEHGQRGHHAQTRPDDGRRGHQ
uniref:ATP-NAD kinase n=1 Tax=Candidatus Caldatribacterium saccharofermentans TaxID=1454753 RepID=A0A7V4TIH5_9BACT